MSTTFHCAFCEWVAKRATRIQEDGVEYNGLLITEQTEVINYKWTVFGVLFTFSGDTSHCPVEQDSGGAVSTVLTLLLGWWGFPWGPFHTVGTFTHNLANRGRTTVAGIIAKEKWGITTVGGGSQVPKTDTPTTFTDAAFSEISRRRTENGFSASMAVKLLKHRPRKRHASYNSTILRVTVISSSFVPRHSHW